MKVLSLSQLFTKLADAPALDYRPKKMIGSCTNYHHTFSWFLSSSLSLKTAVLTYVLVLCVTRIRIFSGKSSGKRNHANFQRDILLHGFRIGWISSGQIGNNNAIRNKKEVYYFRCIAKIK